MRKNQVNMDELGPKLDRLRILTNNEGARLVDEIRAELDGTVDDESKATDKR